MKKSGLVFICCLTFIVMSACGGGDGSSSNENTSDANCALLLTTYPKLVDQDMSWVTLVRADVLTEFGQHFIGGVPLNLSDQVFLDYQPAVKFLAERSKSEDPEPDSGTPPPPPELTDEVVASAKALDSDLSKETCN